jgi:hypothetical protein
MSTTSDTPIQSQLWARRRRAIRLVESGKRDERASKRSVTPARGGRVVARLLGQNGHWAMASKDGAEPT